MFYHEYHMMIFQFLYVLEGNYNVNQYIIFCPHKIIKALQQIYQTPLYIDEFFSIRPIWQSLIELANAINDNQLHKHESEKEFDISHLDTFEELIEENYG